MLIGYNNDVQYRGKTFHIQTEDRGLATKQIETQIFHSGAILDTRIVSYEDLMKEKSKDARNRSIKSLMQATHKELFKNLMSGKYDHFVGLEPTKSAGTKPPEVVAQDFTPGQDRVPESARRVEAGESIDIRGITGEQQDEHVDLGSLKSKLAQMGADESDSDEDLSTQMSSLDVIPDLLQSDMASRGEGSKTALLKRVPSLNVKSLSVPSHKKAAHVDFPSTDTQAWQGCQPPREELSVVALIEKYLKG